MNCDDFKTLHLPLVYRAHAVLKKKGLFFKFFVTLNMMEEKETIFIIIISKDFGTYSISSFFNQSKKL